MDTGRNYFLVIGLSSAGVYLCCRSHAYHDGWTNERFRSIFTMDFNSRPSNRPKRRLYKSIRIADAERCLQIAGCNLQSVHIVYGL